MNCELHKSEPSAGEMSLCKGTGHDIFLNYIRKA